MGEGVILGDSFPGLKPGATIGRSAGAWNGTAASAQSAVKDVCLLPLFASVKSFASFAASQMRGDPFARSRCPFVTQGGLS